MLSLICDAKSFGWRWVNRTIETCRHRIDGPVCPMQRPCTYYRSVLYVCTPRAQWMSLAKLQTNKNYFSAV